MRASIKKSIPVIAAVGAALLMTLTACTPAAEAPAQPTATAAATPVVTEEPPQCSGLTGVEALEQWANEVETSRPWDLTGANSDVTGYDECAELSWMVLRPTDCCTVFEITPVMFFHRGEFIPTATVTDRALARTAPAGPSERIADDEVALTFATPGGPNQPPVLTTVTYAWDESTGVVVPTEPEPEVQEPEGGTVDGHWCPTPESNDMYGCVTVAFPTATYDSGDTLELTDMGDAFGDGGTQYGGLEAPFGTFYPAGVAIDLPDYYAGSDLADQDRIWNGQTATMLIRQ